MENFLLIEKRTPKIRNVSLFSSIMLGFSLSAIGQDFLAISPLSQTLDNFIESTNFKAGVSGGPVAPESVSPLGQPALKLLQEHQLDNWLLFYPTKYSINYGYNRTNSFVGDNGRVNTNTVSGDIFYEAICGWSLDGNFTYQHDQKTNNAPSSTDTNSYGFSIQPGVDLLLLGHENQPPKERLRTPNPNSLTLAAGVGYGRALSEMDANTGHLNTTGNAFKFSPSLTYVHVFTNVTFALSAAYTDQWKDNSPNNKPDINTDSGIFSLTERQDIRIFPRKKPQMVADPSKDSVNTDCTKKTNNTFTLEFGETWKHDINQRVAPGMPEYFRDWAQLSVGLKYEFLMNPCGKYPTPFSAMISYTYEGFRPDYNINGLMVQIQTKY